MRIVRTDALATRAFRRALLRPNWPLDQPVHGDDAPDAVHLAAVDHDDRLLGACLLLPRPYPRRQDLVDAWQLRGMATATDRRGTGIGSAVLAEAIAEARGHGGRLLWCEARVAAVAFYAKHGFTADGPEYSHAETGTTHQLMWRSIDEREPGATSVAS